MTMINEKDMYGMHELETDTSEMLANKIDEAYNRQGKKINCSLCEDDWFEKDMIIVNNKKICPICAAVNGIE